MTIVAERKSANLWASDGGLLWGRVGGNGPIICWKQAELIAVFPGGVAHQPILLSWPPCQGGFYGTEEPGP